MPLKTSCKVALVAALPWILLGDRCISDSGTEDGTSDDGHTSPVTYVPVLEEYQNDEDLMGIYAQCIFKQCHLYDAPL